MYSKRITRESPAAFLFLIDRSGSMSDRITFGDRIITKAEAVSSATNSLIQELLYRSVKENGIADYFEIYAIAYGAGEAQMILGSEYTPARPAVLAQSPFPREVRSFERVLPSGRTVIATEETTQWITPVAEGNTPMLGALKKAAEITRNWCDKRSNRANYPPTIFNFTDGEASDADAAQLLSYANQIKSLGTEDGQALLFNIHITDNPQAQTVLFPSATEELGFSRYGSLLYEMSSVLPEAYEPAIREIYPDSKGPYKGLAVNCSAAQMITMMEIGSRSKNFIG